jgi:serpin B
MKRMTVLVLALLLGAPMALGVAAREKSIPELVEGNTAFAFDLYGELRQGTDGNLIFSPYSASQALAMTYTGAEGETATQIEETLGFSLAEPALHEAFGALNADLGERGTAADDPDAVVTARALRVANGLWSEQTYPFSSAFIAELAELYGAGLQEADFVNGPEAARKEINSWVAEQTENRIQDIVPEGVIDERTRLVLANAIYFYGGWEHPFDPELTADDDFSLLDGTSVSVPFMGQTGNLPYTRGDGFRVIEFPYAGSGFTFTVFLPDDGRFAAFEERLDSGTMVAALGQLMPTDVIVYLPKFEFDFGAGLVKPLQSLGMTDAFDMERADFTGMIEGSPREPLYISDVLHKAFISLDEEGTEAAAATAVIITERGGPPPVTEPVEVRIDRPFLFAIRDTRTGTVLFLGRVMDPSVAAEPQAQLAGSHECSEGA